MKRGFTLVELLIVITIIGILSALVLVNLRSATNRARDGRIVSDMAQIRSAAEVFYGNNNMSYQGLCTDADIVALRDDMVNNNGGTGWVCGATTTSYCAKIQLHGGQWWCVDSNLRSKQYATSPATCTATCTDCKCE